MEAKWLNDCHKCKYYEKGYGYHVKKADERTFIVTECKHPLDENSPALTPMMIVHRTENDDIEIVCDGYEENYGTEETVSHEQA